MPARRSWFSGVLTALLAMGACSDSGGPSGPSAVAVVSGGGQSAHVNAALAQPLVVRVTGSGGAAFPGATVAWTVTSGSATLAPTSSASDADGRATTVVTLGSTPGVVVVSASTSGLAPVTFALTAVGPAALAVVSGNGQTGPVGGAMAESLRVALTGTDGLPYAGAAVSWATTAGVGTATPPVATTAASGEAATLLAPAAAGNLTVTASSGAATPATFSATAVPPCEYLRPHDLGDVVNGTLSTLDCGVNLGAIFYYDFYQLDFAAQQSFTVGMSSTVFDTYVDLFNAAGAWLGFNDDSLNLSTMTTNSYFEGIFAAGNYVIGASSWDPATTGSYTVRSAVRAPTIVECRDIWANRGVAISETITATDCIDTSTGSTFYSDRLILGLETGATMTAHLTSGEVNPNLILYAVPAGTIVASNDDSTVGNSTAYFSYTVSQGGFFVLDMGTAVAGQTGAYTLTLGGAPILAGAAATGAASPFRAPAMMPRGAGGKSPISVRAPRRDRP